VALSLLTFSVLYVIVFFFWLNTFRARAENEMEKSELAQNPPNFTRNTLAPNTRFLCSSVKIFGLRESKYKLNSFSVALDLVFGYFVLF